MTNADCPFCNIIAGELPSADVYEDDRTKAFLDIAPVNPGHVLVVPKKHSCNLFDTDDDTLAALAVVTKRVAAAVKEGTNAKGVNISINNGEAAGQVVPHLHFHVIPRYDKDNAVHWKHDSYPDGEINAVGDRIRAAIDKSFSPM